MDAVKPLIFVHPLSPTLQKLKEVSEESAEADGVEIYEIDDMMEFNQLFPSVGQSVCLFSDAKKCAKALQSNKRVMKSIHSKVILVSPKKIPPKTLEKFDKVGLTECITEPVAPKTLMYKVKLQLRSIKAQSTDDEEEEKTFSRNEAKKKEEEDSYYRGKQAKKGETEEESVDYRKKYKKTHEEDIDDKDHGGYSYNEKQNSHWKGKLHNDEGLDEDEKDKKEKYREDAIDTHYKGKSKKGELEFEDDIYEEDKSGNNLEEDEELENIKKSLSLEVEQAASSYNTNDDFAEDEEDNRKKDKSLELDLEESTKKKRSSNDSIDSHMKGDLQRESESEEKNRKHDTTRDHLEDDKMRGDLGGYSSPEEDEDNEKRAKNQLEIEAEERDKKDPKSTEEIDTPMKHDGVAIQEDNDPLSHEKKNKSKNIEKFIKGSLFHLNEEAEDDEYIDNETKLDIEAAKKDKEARDIGELDEEDESQKKRDHNLEIEAGSSKQKEEPHKEDETSHAAQNSRSPDQQDDSPLQKDAAPLEGQANERGQRSGPQDDGSENYKSTSSKNFQKDKDAKNRDYDSQDKSERPKEAQRADNRADRLKKHYKGKGNRHDEQGWGNLHQRQSQTDDDFGARKRDDDVIDNEGEFKPEEERQAEVAKAAKKQGPSYSVEQEDSKNAGELHYAQDELGEQTIDYAKLKDEFDAIPYDLKDKKKIWTEYEGKDKKSSDISISDAKNAENLTDIDPTEAEKELNDEFFESTEDSDDQEELVFEPFSCGLEEVIRNQQFYHDRDITYKEFLLQMAEKIRERHSGLASFYSLKQNTQTPSLEICPFENILPSEQSGELHKKWEELKNIKLPFWQQMRLPAWSDKTFQDQELDFFYPYFDHNKFMGFAVIYFSNGFKESESKELEVFLESAKGFYTEHFYQKSTKRNEFTLTDNQTKQSIGQGAPPKKTGFFSKLFGKRAS